ncbi:glutathione binding-like protein [Saccharospirillum mangrovi]|uniref:glutathione binding-like protein n=1 Tax=Saccharospirillum mangrovi TaxID=2161747 RepID=UPI000D33DE89|nr:glutathione binding-like protein [Saccharospirillum mangrovi]
MTAFPKRWPVENPDVLQLYSMATPNGQKIGIMLEEIGLPYEAHTVNIIKNEQFDEDYLQLNPNNKIPSIIDPNGPNGEPLHLMETGAILIYLAEKSGKFLPTDPARRLETLQWLFFQTAHVGPMLGQFGHFYKFAADKSDDYSKERFITECRRILGVLDKRLEGRDWIMGDELTIADFAIGPWIKCIDFYEGHGVLKTAEFKNVMAYCERLYARPNVKTGAAVCALG